MECAKLGPGAWRAGRPTERLQMLAPETETDGCQTVGEGLPPPLSRISGYVCQLSLYLYTYQSVGSIRIVAPLCSSQCRRPYTTRHDTTNMDLLDLHGCIRNGRLSMDTQRTGLHGNLHCLPLSFSLSTSRLIRGPRWEDPNVSCR